MKDTLSNEKYKKKKKNRKKVKKCLSEDRQQKHVSCRAASLLVSIV